MRSAMRAASQLPGRGPTVVDIAPIQKTDYDDDEYPHCQIYDRTKFHTVKGIDNAFDYGMCDLSYKQKNYFSENSFVLPRNYFHNRISRKQLICYPPY